VFLVQFFGSQLHDFIDPFDYFFLKLQLRQLIYLIKNVSRVWFDSNSNKTLIPQSTFVLVPPKRWQFMFTP